MSHTKAKYFSDMVIEDEHWEMDFPNIRCLMLELHMNFIFQDSSECNVNIMREFYANWKIGDHSHYVKMRGVEVLLTPTMLKQLLGLLMPPRMCS